MIKTETIVYTTYTCDMCKLIVKSFLAEKVHIMNERDGNETFHLCDECFHKLDFTLRFMDESCGFGYDKIPLIHSGVVIVKSNSCA